MLSRGNTRGAFPHQAQIASQTPSFPTFPREKWSQGEDGRLSASGESLLSGGFPENSMLFYPTRFSVYKFYFSHPGDWVESQPLRPAWQGFTHPGAPVARSNLWLGKHLFGEGASNLTVDPSAIVTPGVRVVEREMGNSFSR